MTAAQTIPLYEGTIPNSKAHTDAEETTINGDGVKTVSAISKPTLTIFLPPREKANGTAVIIFPGGGYWVNAIEHEGTAVARKFNEIGVTAFVVKYRIPNTNTMLNKEIGPLQDAQQAIRIVRKRAKEWNINADKVGIMGFSAGGHVASTAGTHFTTLVIDNVDKISLRPDFMILIYPVISFQSAIAHMGSREQLLGKEASPQKINLYSNELQVTPQTPPTFLLHTSDDTVVNAENSVLFYSALLKNNVGAELHIYERGGHGFGMNNKTTSDQWMERCEAWVLKR
jgi:acetyl esterase/lipase